MKQSLSYGRIRLGYEEDTLRPSPLLFFTPIRYQGRPRVPNISDRDSLSLMKLKGEKKISFRDAYVESVCKDSRDANELGEGRALLRWLRKNKMMILWKDGDFKMHSFFENGPGFDENDELSRDHSFSIVPVTVMGRLIKLYIEDEAMLALLSLDFGEEENFVSLVRRYIARRIQWEHWRAPAPTFLDWVRVEGKKPVFNSGEVGFHPPHSQN
ncbi:MAG: hypothetical protein V4598_12760 [Bdellovibrionota bacterium]